MADLGGMAGFAAAVDVPGVVAVFALALVFVPSAILVWLAGPMIGSWFLAAFCDFLRSDFEGRRLDQGETMSMSFEPLLSLAAVALG